MFTIVSKEELAPEIKLMEIDAPEIARKAKPGQFVVIRIDEQGERVPLTIADYHKENGTITIIYQEVGRTTKQLGQLKGGDGVLDVIGPLGKASEIDDYGLVVCVGGGVGIAPVFPIARALREAGNRVISIIGARSSDLLFWKERMAEISTELFITTDDGSLGRRGFVSDELRDLIERGKKINLVYAIGPVVMMRAVCEVTRLVNIPTIVSLNSIMIDATGMCGGCRVMVGKETQFTCVDGPEFDGHKVDFDLLLKRLDMYKEEEKIAMDRCKLDKCEL